MKKCPRLRNAQTYFSTTQQFGLKRGQEGGYWGIGLKNYMYGKVEVIMYVIKSNVTRNLLWNK